jgi:hypothetical protein
MIVDQEDRELSENSKCTSFTASREPDRYLKRFDFSFAVLSNTP